MPAPGYRVSMPADVLWNCTVVLAAQAGDCPKKITELYVLDGWFHST